MIPCQYKMSYLLLIKREDTTIIIPLPSAATTYYIPVTKPSPIGKQVLQAISVEIDIIGL